MRLGLRLRRRLRGSQLRPGALERCWQSRLPGGNCDWREVDFLVADGEMSSLDVRDGELLSLGWVCVQSAAVSLATAAHCLLQPQAGVGQSAVVHQLRDVDVAGGMDSGDALDAMLDAAQGKVLVLHNARLDLAYLDRLAMQRHGAPLLLPVVDTLVIEQRLLTRRGREIRQGDLTLAACRARYGLPSYAAHNALTDAIATAELLLAHAASRGSGIGLKDLW